MVAQIRRNGYPADVHFAVERQHFIVFLFFGNFQNTLCGRPYINLCLLFNFIDQPRMVGMAMRNQTSVISRVQNVFAYCLARLRGFEFQTAFNEQFCFAIADFDQIDPDPSFAV